MSKLTIKSGCVEAVFKRGRQRTKGTERTQPLKNEQPTLTSETPLQDAERDSAQPMAQFLDGGTSLGK